MLKLNQLLGILKGAAMPIRAALFDIGRVIVGFNTSMVSHQLARYSSLSPFNINDRIFRVFADGERKELLEDFEEGRIVPLDFYEHIRTLIKARPELTFELFCNIWTSMFYENRGINEIIRGLKGHNVICIAVSNTDKLIWDWLVDHIPTIREHFSDPISRILSFETGFPKPNHRTWRTALDRAQCPSEQIVYIDDIKSLLSSFSEFCSHATNTIHYNCDREPSEELSYKLHDIGAL